MEEILLSPEEARVVGALIEKEITTPEYYPLTLNSLVNACNQKSNREPVVNYDEAAVENAINDLREKQVVRRVTGSDMRVPKYRQVLNEKLNLNKAETAVICVLLLRGAQTVGEIKGRTGRMFEFESLAQAEETLTGLMSRENKLVVKLPRQPGTKESRYAHLLCGQPAAEQAEPQTTPAVDALRMEELENEVAFLKGEVETLKEQFRKFKEQFE